MQLPVRINSTVIARNYYTPRGGLFERNSKVFNHCQTKNLLNNFENVWFIETLIYRKNN